MVSIQNASKKKGRRILNFLMNNKKIKLIYKTLSPAIHLDGWARHLKHECISSLKIYYNPERLMNDLNAP